MQSKTLASLSILLIMLLSGCASAAKPSVILTNSQFECLDPPSPPKDTDLETQRGRINVGGYIIDMETAYNNCQGRLYELKDVIQVQGGVVTDVLVTEKKKGFWPF